MYVLAVCHEHHLVHTDVKPENVLFRDSSFDLSSDPAPHAAKTVSSTNFLLYFMRHFVIISTIYLSFWTCF